MSELTAFLCAGTAAAHRRLGEWARPLGMDVRMVEVPCGGKVEVVQILRALLVSEGVLVAGCPADACRHLTGNVRARARVAYVQGLLPQLRLEPQRVAWAELGPDGAIKLERALGDLAESLSGLGPNRGRVSAR
ncbi:MAG: hydrogenase iron-sulfur subunit [Bacillota bacterium]